MYSIDLENIAHKLIPLGLRKLKFANFIKAVVKPMSSVRADFKKLISRTNYDLSFTGQVIYLEHLLNNEFDNVNREIYIVDGANIAYNYVYNKAEQKPALHIYNDAEAEVLYIKNSMEYSTVVQFKVMVEQSIVYDEFIMRQLIDKYRQAGVNYTIETY